MKHNGINATRDVLKDQLVLAADEIIRLRASEAHWKKECGHWHYAFGDVNSRWLNRDRAPKQESRLAVWVRRVWA